MTTHALIILSDTVATRLTPNGVHSGMDITLQNTNTEGYIFLGGADVTASNYGYRLSVNNSVAWELPGKDALYAIADTDGLKVAIIRTNLESGN